MELTSQMIKQKAAELGIEIQCDTTVLSVSEDKVVTCVSREPEHLRILEYLGNRDHIPGLIAALGATEATVRAPGTGTPFAMYLPLTGDCAAPSYYPFALD